jgi:hypothetical protein
MYLGHSLLKIDVRDESIADIVTDSNGVYQFRPLV